MTLSDPQGVCIALTADTLDLDPEWTRLDDPDGYNVAVAWSIHRGRSSEMDKTGTGIASISFKDTTGLLDPTNTTSPFYDTGGTATMLDPMKQIAIALQHPISGTWFPLFRGFLSAQQHDMEMWSDERGLDTVTWECADLFDVLAAYILTPGSSGDIPSVSDFADVYYHGIPSNLEGEPDAFVHVDDRIAQLLDDAQIPTIGEKIGPSAGLRDLFSGNVSDIGKVYDRGDQLLAAMFDAADSEFPGVANIYMSKTGVVTFRGRFARFNPTNPGYGIATWNAGGMPEALADSTVAPIAGLSFRRSKDDIINSVVALPQGASDADANTQLVEDAVSIARFGVRSERFTDLQTSAGHDDDFDPTTGLEETHKFAEYYVGNYKDPKTRVSLLRFRPRGPEDVTAPALWDLMCGVEIGDRIHLTTTHVGGGSFDEYLYVEGIRYEARGAADAYHDITLELELSPSSFFDYNPFGTADGTA